MVRQVGSTKAPKRHPASKAPGPAELLDEEGGEIPVNGHEEKAQGSRLTDDKPKPTPAEQIGAIGDSEESMEENAPAEEDAAETENVAEESADASKDPVDESEQEVTESFTEEPMETEVVPEKSSEAAVKPTAKTKPKMTKGAAKSKGAAEENVDDPASESRPKRTKRNIKEASGVEKEPAVDPKVPRRKDAGPSQPVPLDRPKRNQTKATSAAKVPQKKPAAKVSQKKPAKATPKPVSKRKGESSRKSADDEKKSASRTPRTKRMKLALEMPAFGRVSGKVFVVGQNDVGQLGLPDDCDEVSRPKMLDLPYDVVDVVAGGMHSMCLTSSGEVITFGCNDEGALGRVTANAVDPDELSRRPTRVEIPEKVVQISAGDSHSAALTESGKVYLWGNFRNNNGSMGLVVPGAMHVEPIHILTDKTVVQIASGADHLVCLTREGAVFTCGCGESGQLGRLTSRAANSTARGGTESHLKPSEVVVGKPSVPVMISNIWTGSYSTFVRAAKDKKIWSFGLNNHNQMGFENVDDSNEAVVAYRPKHVKSFDNILWSKIEGDQHHTLALDDKGSVYSLGDGRYGRLGLGDQEDKSEPTMIPALEGKSEDVSSGNCVSYAITNDGSLFSWGMGSSNQLGHGHEEDILVPQLVKGEFGKSWRAYRISGGGQHALILAGPRNTQ